MKIKNSLIWPHIFRTIHLSNTKKIGAVKAANELQIPVNTLYGWIRKVKIGSLDIGCGERSPEESLNIAEENQQLRKRIKALEKENKRLSEINEFLRNE